MCIIYRDQATFSCGLGRVDLGHLFVDDVYVHRHYHVSAVSDENGWEGQAYQSTKSRGVLKHPQENNNALLRLFHHNAFGGSAYIRTLPEEGSVNCGVDVATYLEERYSGAMLSKN